MRLRFPTPCALAGAMLLAACMPGCGGAPVPGEAAGAFAPIDESRAIFWDRQTTESAALLRAIAGEFNTAHSGPPVVVERAGGYSEIFRKVSASIRARKLPAMAVSYESMTAEYAAAGAAAPLDPWMADPELGLDAAALEDFFPEVLASNRFDQLDGRMYSFPFAKSVLMLYYNKRVLREAGIAAPPETWAEFLDQCRQVKARTGRHAHAISVDCSTVSAVIFSHGGDVYADGTTRFDQPAAIAAFGLYETLVKEDLAYQITPGTFDDEVALANDQIAFTLRTSSGRASIAYNMGDPTERWGWKRIPQADPTRPATVIFGPNVTIFNTTPEQQRAAWAFVRHFTAPDTAARWAVETGYLPVRRSAIDHPLLQAHWAAWDEARAAYDCLPFARVEPNVIGWQEVRGLVERALTEVITGLKSAEEAARALKPAADAALARHARDTVR